MGTLLVAMYRIIFQGEGIAAVVVAAVVAVVVAAAAAAAAGHVGACLMGLIGPLPCRGQCEGVCGLSMEKKR